MSGFGPRTYLVGQLLPILLPKAEDLDEAIRVAMYIADLTLTRMGKQHGERYEG